MEDLKNKGLLDALELIEQEFASKLNNSSQINEIKDLAYCLALNDVRLLLYKNLKN